MGGWPGGLLGSPAVFLGKWGPAGLLGKWGRRTHPDRPYLACGSWTGHGQNAKTPFDKIWNVVIETVCVMRIIRSFKLPFAGRPVGSFGTIESVAF